MASVQVGAVPASRPLAVVVEEEVSFPRAVPVEEDRLASVACQPLPMEAVAASQMAAVGDCPNRRLPEETRRPARPMPMWLLAIWSRP